MPDPEPAPAPASLPVSAAERPLSRGAAVNLAARIVTVEAALLTLFSGLGLWLAREVSHRGAQPAALLARLLVIGLVAGALAGLLLAGTSMLASADPYRQLWLLAVAAPFLLLVPTASGLWLGQGRMLPLNLPPVVTPALVLAGLAVMLLRGEVAASLFAVLAVWVGAKAIVGVLTAAFAWRDARRDADVPAPGLDTDASGALRFVATVALTNLVSLLNYRATLFIVEREAGLAATGVYSVAVQVAELLWLLSSAVTVSAYHRIGAADGATAARTTLGAVRFNLVATLLAAPVLYVAAAWAVPAWLGEAYAPALLPLALLLPGVAAYAAASSLSAYYTNHRGRPQWSAAIAGLSLALTLAIAWVAVPRYGAAGAAAATSLAYAIAIAVALSSFLRDAGLPWRALWRTQA